MPKDMYMTGLAVNGLIDVVPVEKISLVRPAKYWPRSAYTIPETSASMDTEQTFDQEFSVEEITNAIVNQAKAEVKSLYGNKKRHRQY